MGSEARGRGPGDEAAGAGGLGWRRYPGGLASNLHLKGQLEQPEDQATGDSPVVI